MLSGPVYVGVPIRLHPPDGLRLTASCGHQVWVDGTWRRAQREGKRLLCLDCWLAVAEEHDAIALLWSRGRPQ